jgi:hypothetical protein
MLTGDGLRERKWGGLPALRKVLEDKPESDRYHGLTSVSDNIFEAFSRFLNVAALATEHKEDLLTAVHGDPQFAEAAIDDLQRLVNALSSIRELVSNEIRDLDKLCGEVHYESRRDARR